MRFEETAWDKSDELFLVRKKLFNEESLRKIVALIIKHRVGPTTELFSTTKRVFNVVLPP